MITPRARAEADYYLGFDALEQERTTDADYEEWFEHDSRGKGCRPDNPIYCAKAHYGMWIKMLQESRWLQEGQWPGGIWMLDLPMRVLREAFGEESVRVWAEEAFRQWRRIRPRRKPSGLCKCWRKWYAVAVRFANGRQYRRTR